MSRILLLFYLLSSGLLAFSQAKMEHRFLLKIKLDDGRSYTQTYNHLEEIIYDPNVLKLGITYQKDIGSFKIHGDGSFFINDLGAYVSNQQFEELQEKYGRYGTEHEVKEIGKDSILVSNVFWKNGKRYPIDKKVEYVGGLSEEEVKIAEKENKGKESERQEIQFGKALKWEKQVVLDKGTWEFGKSKNVATVINFWFVGCKPCEEEIPELNKLVEKYGKEGVEFVAFGLDNEADITRFLAKTPFQYRIIPNAKTTIQNLGIHSFPTHLILDKKGNVRYYQEGYRGNIDVELGKILEELL